MLNTTVLERRVSGALHLAVELVFGVLTEHESIALSEALNVFMRDSGGLGGIDAFFGGGAKARQAKRRGQDLRVALRLTLEDVAHGTNRSLKVKALVPCARCGGSGGKPGTLPARCGTCGGTGEVRRTSQSIFGQFMSVAPCPVCESEGTVIAEPCELCRGDGRVRAERLVDVEVTPTIFRDHVIGAGSVGEQLHHTPRPGGSGAQKRAFRRPRGRISDR